MAVLAATANSALSFGQSLILAPFLFLYLPTTSAVAIAVLLSAAITSMMLGLENRTLEVDFYALRYIGISAVPASLAGLYLITHLDKQILQVCVGILTVVSVLARQALTDRDRNIGPRGLAIAGALSGCMNTAVGLSGPPLVIALIHRGHRGEALRDTLAASLFTVSVVGIPLVLLGINSYDSLKTVLKYSLLLLPAIVTGHRIGRLAFVRVSAERHIVAMKTVVVLAGLVSITSAMVGG